MLSAPPVTWKPKRAEFQTYYNEARGHASLDGAYGVTFGRGHAVVPAGFQRPALALSHCRGLVQLALRPPENEFETHTVLMDGSVHQGNGSI